MTTRKETSSEWLNYHHLGRFWVIARSRTLSDAARTLHVSQSTLSIQLRELEEWLGQPLFERGMRRLRLNAAGHMAYEHAETIFRAGHELMDNFRGQEPGRMRVLRIGAVGNLSKNLQFDLLRPLLADPSLRVSVEAGSHAELVRRLGEHHVDVVLSHSSGVEGETAIESQELGSMPVCLTGTWSGALAEGSFPRNLVNVPLFLPTRTSQVRIDFDRRVEAAGISLDIRAEVDDMALLRLMALSGLGLALVPAIVVEHEINRGLMRHVSKVRGLNKRFHVLTLRRRVSNLWLDGVIVTFRREFETTASKLRKRGTHSTY